MKGWWQEYQDRVCLLLAILPFSLVIWGFFFGKPKFVLVGLGFYGVVGICVVMIDWGKSAIDRFRKGSS